MATINSTLISGAGAFTALLPLLAGKRRILLVTDANVGKLDAAQQIRALLEDEGRQLQVMDSVPAEPSQHDMAQILRLVSANQAELIVGIGGGSVLDVTKLLSVLLHPRSPGLDALLAGEKPQQKVTSLLIPATAGTGSEATPNAILAIPEQNTKVGIISPVLLPDYVALLPELTTSMPAHIASSTGIDALCHLIECFTSTVANPVSDNAALIGLRKLVRNIELSVSEPHNLAAKLEMLWASYYGGVAINHAGTHLVHALSYPLGGKYHLPHGVANAVLLPHIMAYNAEYTGEKYRDIAVALGNKSAATMPIAEARQAAIEAVAQLNRDVNIPARLRDVGMKEEDIDALAAAALADVCTGGNPRDTNLEEIKTLYRQIF